jgi:cell division protease FtsH
LAELLIQREVIFAEDVERIFGKRPWASRAEEIINQNENENDNANPSTGSGQDENVNENLKL